MTISSLPLRRAISLVLLAVAPVLATDFHRVAHAQGIGATGKQRVLVIPIQRGEDVSSVVPGRVDEYIRTLLEMSGKIEVLGVSDLVDKPVKPVAIPVETDKVLLKADEALWKGKEAAEKGQWGQAIKLFKRSAKLYEKRFDKLVDFDKYIDASLGVSLGYFLAGFEDNGEDALAPVVVLRPDIILDKRKVPKPAIAALERLTKLYAGGTKGETTVISNPPGAEVFLDGNLVGRTPHTMTGQHRGRHVVRVVMPGFQPWAKSFNAGSRNQKIRARLKPVVSAAGARPNLIKVAPEELAAMTAKGNLHRGFNRIAKPIVDRYNVDAIVLFYMRRTPERFELAPFLFDRKANRIAELEWIHLDHNLTTMQVNLIVLDEKLNAALASFPMGRVIRSKSDIYKVIRAPKPKPKPKPTLVLPTRKPAPVVRPKPRPKPAPVVRPKPRPQPAPVVRPKPRPQPAPVVRPKPRPRPRPAAVRPPVQPRIQPAVVESIQVDDGLGGNLGRYAYPDDPLPAVAPRRPTVQLPPPMPVDRPDMSRSSGDAWYTQWWVWSIVGAAVIGGATTAVVLTVDGSPEEFGGTIQW
ncbi:MAG: PEGA domain-containing protein [Myxococcota bacterium]